MSLGHRTIGLWLLVAIALVGAPAEVTAHEARTVAVDPKATPRTFGTSSIVHTIQAHAFTPETAADATNLGTNTLRSRSCIGGADCRLAAPVFLPAGAVLEGFELDACDQGPGIVMAELNRVATGANGTELAAALHTEEDVEAPGCGLFSAAAVTPLTIDNRNNSYHVRVVLLDGASNVNFQAVRLFYRLQTSPAPVAATFDDVPTNHPFFALIEALAAAGITVGCSTTPPLFCPDTVVTRAQMAAFIARALGLHWAP